ncbi:Hcp1 family type VI secretion system effector [Yersinia pekkanenii]|uniref:Hcp1 family type VI secretion system effector n=1 Tax=Yersinia pekkanenii TaxID=1288385 RepID=A0A0T9QWQ0_9GAMM|nr:Hcp1 family type VI secretion system effector [Yersinia pekkanenii]CRY66181.1 Hcp1 family type VI secretion system effector [Yersinia pekkanenii]
MANSIYLTLQGAKQGLISAGCGSLDSIGNKSQSTHQDQIFVYALQHMISRVQNSHHHPIVFRNPLINHRLCWVFLSLKMKALSVFSIFIERTVRVLRRSITPSN